MDTNTQYARAWATENVWSAPHMSAHYRLQPRRLTVSSGVFRQVSIAVTRENTPDRFNRWHIYQIGGIDPSFFRLFSRGEEWINFTEVMNKNKLMVHLHAGNGVEIPRSDAYYKFNNYGNLIVAVKVNKVTKYNYGSDTLTMRMFANEWWRSNEGLDNDVGFHIEGKTVESSAQIAAFVSSYTAAVATLEHPFQIAYWHNGVRKATLVAGDIKVGDAVEYIVDGSIYRKQTFTVGELEAFLSTMDNRQKYLVHLPKPEGSTFPEMHLSDMYVRHKTHSESIFLHRSSAWAIRGLTHNDFSVAVNVMNAVINSHNTLYTTGTNVNNYQLDVFMRRSAAEHELVLDTGFVAELYKLPDVEITKAMVGPDSTIPFWRAAELEKSGYNKLVYAERVCDITGQMIEEGLGYYALASILANTPMYVINPGSSGFVELPFMLSRGATIYEYDENGFFLKWYHHYTGTRYYVQDERCHMVEVVSGLGGNMLEEIHGQSDVALATDRNWRVYSRQRIGGAFTGKPVDVTGTDKYEIVQGKFIWKDTDISRYPTVRSDARFFAADYDVVIAEGVLQIPLLTSQTHAGVTSSSPIGIPLGQLDVIFNGRSLVYGLQYFYLNGTIYITAKAYAHLSVNGVHKVHVRFMGFCQDDMSIWPETDTGFIVHGKASHNHRFNLRYGRVMRAIINGSLTDLKTPTFAEDSSDPDPSNPMNGAPYVIKDLFIPLKPYMSKDTWTMIKQANERSKAVSDFLTLRSPGPDLSATQAVITKHLLYSPFMAKIISDMTYGRLTLPNATSFTQQQVATLCKNYEYLLEVDPARMKLDARFVNIQPHLNLGPISVQANAYAFLDAVNRFYMAGKVNLANSVSISG